MDERTRVQNAIEGPVADAVKLLDEARGADTETRLMMLINGWGRGLAAGLEELALAIDRSRRADSPEPIPHATHDEPDAEPTGVEEPVEAPTVPNATDASNEEELDERGLLARAAESRAATAALRREASSAHEDDK